MRPIIFASLLFILQGCGAAIFGATEITSLSTTGKTASDHVLSFLTGDDCSILGYQKTGHYCRSPAEIAQEQSLIRNAQPYCYRQLSDIVCYQRPDPQATTRTQ